MLPLNCFMVWATTRFFTSAVPAGVALGEFLVELPIIDAQEILFP